jgi:hypothetical protein
LKVPVAHAEHARFEEAVGAVVSYSPVLQTAREVHTRLLVLVFAVLSNCVLTLHVSSAAQTRSEDAVFGVLSYCALKLHVVRSVHTRSVVVVCAVLWYWVSVLHVVRSVHARSEKVVLGVLSYAVFAQTVSGVQTRSEDAVGVVDS